MSKLPLTTEAEVLAEHAMMQSAMLRKLCLIIGSKALATYVDEQVVLFADRMSKVRVGKSAP